MKWYCECWEKYAVLSGRARRTEYWLFVLSNIIVNVMVILIGISVAIIATETSVQAEMTGRVTGLTVLFYCLVTFLPSVSVTVRRLHDTGRSGWFMLIQLIPIVGSIVFFITMLLDSQPDVNSYGPNPKVGG